jgi:hypothetical protein
LESTASTLKSRREVDKCLPDEDSFLEIEGA